MTRELFVLGMSHRTAPLEVREKLAVGSEKLADTLHELPAKLGLQECVLISTCNRVEIYGATDHLDESVASAKSFLQAHIGTEQIDPFLYESEGRDAVKHAFRVASSLDSMVLGEAQILGQVKTSYAAAEQAGTMGSLLGRCFNKAFAVAKRVRTETGLAAGTVSVSSIACELALKIFGDLQGRRVLLVGAGKMSESAARYLRKRGGTLVVLNRSVERAQELAQLYEGEARSFDELANELTLADVVFVSTASPRFVITPELMQSVMRPRRHRMILLVDISVPRNVDPRVGNMDNVFLYDVDDLQKVSAENLAMRRKEAAAAERIVDSEVEEFERWRRSLALTPTIVALRSRFEQTIRAELERAIAQSGSSSGKPIDIEATTRALTNKLLHTPVSQLKAKEDAHLLEAVSALFELTDPDATPQANLAEDPDRNLSVSKRETQ